VLLPRRCRGGDDDRHFRFMNVGPLAAPGRVGEQQFGQQRADEQHRHQRHQKYENPVHGLPPPRAPFAPSLSYPRFGPARSPFPKDRNK
jgi:hypothetical protein